MTKCNRLLLLLCGVIQLNFAVTKLTDLSSFQVRDFSKIA